MSKNEYEVIRPEGKRYSVVKLNGRLDISNRDAVRKAISSAQEENGVDIRNVVLDMSGVSIILTAGMKELVVLQKEAFKHGRRIDLCGLNGNNRDMLELVGLVPGLFNTYEGLDEATEQYEKRA